MSLDLPDISLRQAQAVDMTDLQGKLLHIISAHGRENPISWEKVRGALELQGVAI